MKFQQQYFKFLYYYFSRTDVVSNDLCCGGPYAKQCCSLEAHTKLLVENVRLNRKQRWKRGRPLPCNVSNSTNYERSKGIRGPSKSGYHTRSLEIFIERPPPCPPVACPAPYTSKYRSYSNVALMLMVVVVVVVPCWVGGVTTTVTMRWNSMVPVPVPSANASTPGPVCPNTRSTPYCIKNGKEKIGVCHTEKFSVRVSLVPLCRVPYAWCGGPPVSIPLCGYWRRGCTIAFVFETKIVKLYCGWWWQWMAVGGGCKCVCVCVCVGVCVCLRRARFWVLSKSFFGDDTDTDGARRDTHQNINNGSSHIAIAITIRQC